ncbi:hypothetical protein DFJ73DRAFT_928901 [Zopfochytrium polystomum]|nr:hypothetical protein DFJ73DRAFT_928901 [Zopfochytrium polystomum]
MAPKSKRASDVADDEEPPSVNAADADADADAHAHADDADAPKRKASSKSASKTKTPPSLPSQGCTVPFIARYRKDATGGLDEVLVEAVIKSKEDWDAVEKRKAFIRAQIEAAGKMTDALDRQLRDCRDAVVLEDLYLPFKMKRTTKASKAREAGLEPFAEWIWERGHEGKPGKNVETLEDRAERVRKECKLTTTKDAIDGASAIIIERLSEMAHLRSSVRDRFRAEGVLSSTKGKGAKSPSKYETYFEYTSKVRYLSNPEQSHRYLAIKRGSAEDELYMKLTVPEHVETNLIRLFEGEAITNWKGRPQESELPATHVLLLKCAKTAYTTYVVPSARNDVLKALQDIADEAAIDVFAENVRKLLLAAPFGPKPVIGVDPGLRTGCKTAVLDALGNPLDHTVLFFSTAAQTERSIAFITAAIQKHNIAAIAVGNGTAGRETAAALGRGLAASRDPAVAGTPVIPVSESGASVYSASALARAELPALDLTVRSAVSIARRLQDPLAELVKYQHDVNPAALKRALAAAVARCVNSVGVNLNTASVALLTHVSGIGPKTAQAVVDHRDGNGVFASRAALMDVPRFSKKAFVQAAGFLRVPESDNLLDNTAVHPENYAVIERFAKKLKIGVAQLVGPAGKEFRQKLLESTSGEVGTYTAQDMIIELERPGRDTREPFELFAFRDDIHTIHDLRVGMECPGLVANVTHFGAFVDIGVHTDGLIPNARGPAGSAAGAARLSPGEKIVVKVVRVDLERGRIGLEKVAKSRKGEDRLRDAEHSGSGDREQPVQEKGVNRRKDDKKKIPDGAGAVVEKELPTRGKMLKRKKDDDEEIVAVPKESKRPRRK